MWARVRKMLSTWSDMESSLALVSNTGMFLSSAQTWAVLVETAGPSGHSSHLLPTSSLGTASCTPCSATSSSQSSRHIRLLGLFTSYTNITASTFLTLMFSLQWSAWSSPVVVLRDGLPEPLLPGRVPDLQSQFLSINLNNLEINQ